MPKTLIGLHNGMPIYFGFGWLSLALFFGFSSGGQLSPAGWLSGLQLKALALQVRLENCGMELILSPIRIMA